MREMVSFEFVKEMEKDVFRCVFDERERKNLWILMRNRTLYQRIPRSDALPLNHRDFTVSEEYL